MASPANNHALHLVNFRNYLLPVLAVLVALGGPLRASVNDSVVLNDSVRTVDQSIATGVVHPHRPYISRTNLKPAQVAAPMKIELALKMRNLPELEARGGKGRTYFRAGNGAEI